MTFETCIIDEVYDFLFKNDTPYSFIDEYPESFVNRNNATIFLCKDRNEIFKIKVERI